MAKFVNVALVPVDVSPLTWKRLMEPLLKLASVSVLTTVPLNCTTRLDPFIIIVIAFGVPFVLMAVDEAGVDNVVNVSLLASLGAGATLTISKVSSPYTSTT